MLAPSDVLILYRTNRGWRPLDLGIHDQTRYTHRLSAAEYLAASFGLHHVLLPSSLHARIKHYFHPRILALGSRLISLRKRLLKAFILTFFCSSVNSSLATKSGMPSQKRWIEDRNERKFRNNCSFKAQRVFFETPFKEVYWPRWLRSKRRVRLSGRPWVGGSNRKAERFRSVDFSRRSIDSDFSS